jgi:hypothetical protein
MSQENVEIVRGLLAHGATRFALLLSLLALGLVACDDDDESAPTETEVITSDFAQDPPGRVVVAAARRPAATTARGPAQSASASRSSKVSFPVARRGAY